MTMYIHSDIGNYNWADPSEKWFHVAIYADGLSLDEKWDVEDQFDCRIDTLTEFLDLLDKFEVRINKYWINSRKEEDLKKVKILRERAPVLVRDMLIERLNKLKKECHALEEEIADLEPDPEYHSPYESKKEE